MAVFMFNAVIYILLLLGLCNLIVRLPCQIFPWFLLGCKTNARVKLAKTRHGPHISVVLFIVCFVSFRVLFVCKCVLYYCHRMATQLQLTNISSYHINSNDFWYFCIQHAPLNKYVETNAVQLLYGCKGRKLRSGINPLIIMLVITWSWTVSFMLRPSYSRYPLFIKIRGCKCRTAKIVEKVIPLTLLVLTPGMFSHATQSLFPSFGTTIN